MPVTPKTILAVHFFLIFGVQIPNPYVHPLGHHRHAKLNMYNIELLILSLPLTMFSQCVFPGLVTHQTPHLYQAPGHHPLPTTALAESPGSPLNSTVTSWLVLTLAALNRVLKDQCVLPWKIPVHYFPLYKIAEPHPALPTALTLPYFPSQHWNHAYCIASTQCTRQRKWINPWPLPYPSLPILSSIVLKSRHFSP